MQNYSTSQGIVNEQIYTMDGIRILKSVILEIQAWYV